MYLSNLLNISFVKILLQNNIYILEFPFYFGNQSIIHSKEKLYDL